VRSSVTALARGLTIRTARFIDRARCQGAPVARAPDSVVQIRLQKPTQSC
jgi:hypothetical protein